MDATVAALLGAVIGGLLSVLASWLAQRVQAKAQWLTQESQRRQQLYSDFVESAARCFADALQHEEPNPGALAKFYGCVGRIRFQSSEPVIVEAYRIAHKILETYHDPNRTGTEVRDFLAHDSIDLFSDFGDACRGELVGIQPRGGPTQSRVSFRLTPLSDAPASQSTD
jgi:hypothetical protein